MRGARLWLATAAAETGMFLLSCSSLPSGTQPERNTGMKKKSRKQEPSLLPFESPSEPPPQFEVVLTRPAAVPVRGAPTPPYDEATGIDSSFTYTVRQYQAILE